jgi:predicted RNase H-like HicB family nuclease
VPKPVIAFFATLRKILRKAEDRRPPVQHSDVGVAHEGQWKLRVAVEEDPLDGGFIAEIVDVPGAVAQGETRDEAIANVFDAFKGILEVRLERACNAEIRPDDPERGVVYTFAL